MAKLLSKRGKFLEGHSYATGVGYSFSWTRDEAQARRFADDEPNLGFFANITGAKVVDRENTRREQRELGRRRRAAVEFAADGQRRAPSLDERINRRAA